jgi:hypothetical protein
MPYSRPFPQTQNKIRKIQIVGSARQLSRTVASPIPGVGSALATRHAETGECERHLGAESVAF